MHLGFWIVPSATIKHVGRSMQPATPTSSHAIQYQVGTFFQLRSSILFYTFFS